MPTRSRPAGPTGRASTAVLVVYTATVFTSAALLFLVQPMFARMALPRLGGSPAVWNTAVVFYQFALLAGYTYAYVTTRTLSTRAQLAAHGVILLAPLFVLPFGIPPDWAPRPDYPATSLLVLLTVGVGLPFFVVSTTAPLLQRWFVASGHPHGSDPYFLYAASNAGSLLALIAYPVAIERWLPLGDQSRWWAAGYGLFAGLCVTCGVLVWRQVSTPTELSRHRASDGPTLPDAIERSNVTTLHWLALAAVPVSLMLSLTTYLTTDLSAVPLLWVIPLAVYLLTFILTFARSPPLSPRLVLALVPFALAGLIFLVAAKEESTSWWVVTLHMAAFFLIAMACHGRLAALRPDPSRLTTFYLIVSLGGALGGLFNALAAPVLFDHVVEYPLSLILAAGLLLPIGVGSGKPAAPIHTGAAASTRPARSGKSRATRVARPRATPAANRIPGVRGWLLDVVVALGVGAISAALVTVLQEPSRPATWPERGLMFGVPLAVALVFRGGPFRFALSLSAIAIASTLYGAGRGTMLLVDRTFFGINRVVLQPSGRYRVLGHGNTTHGAQSLDPARTREPLTYFHPNGPLGQIFAEFNTTHTGGRIAVVGLGTGSVACYRKPGQQWVFFELDPAVVAIARDTGYFTFLRECAPDAAIVTGDARLSLQRMPDASYDLIVLDAYSSDAIPIHLMTREAVALYIRTLAPGGLLAFNISNRHLDLGRVLASISKDLGLAFRTRDDLTIDPRMAGRGMMPSQWVVVARDTRSLGALADDGRWSSGAIEEPTTVWTDDFNNLLAVFRW